MYTSSIIHRVSTCVPSPTCLLTCPTSQPASQPACQQPTIQSPTQPPTHLCTHVSTYTCRYSHAHVLTHSRPTCPQTSYSRALQHVIYIMDSCFFITLIKCTLHFSSVLEDSTILEVIMLITCAHYTFITCAITLLPVHQMQFVHNSCIIHTYPCIGHRRNAYMSNLPQFSLSPPLRLIHVSLCLLHAPFVAIVLITPATTPARRSIPLTACTIPLPNAVFYQTLCFYCFLQRNMPLRLFGSSAEVVIVCLLQSSRSLGAKE